MNTKFNVLGKRVANTITAASKTRREVAAKLELPTDGLYRRFWGVIPWRVRELKTIADFCGTTVSKLLGEDF
ncbi:MAG: hypothetical protein GY847_27740 [Proteobacteria bacterium]|nr:hypothetical protein [Pseudomonadota bacterium]